MMKYSRNYYVVLHVQPNAPTEIIRSSYRTLMLKLKQHPDIGGNDGIAALINHAYATLSDPDKRAEYDRNLSGCHTEKICKALPAGKAQEIERKTADTRYRDFDSAPISCCLFCNTTHRGDLRMKTGQYCSCCGSPMNSVAGNACLNAHQRRTVRRMAQDRKITFYTAWPQHGFHGHIHDLSPMGMQIHTAEILSKEQLLKIESDVLDAVAMVVYCRSQQRGESERYVVGIRFCTLLFQRSIGTFLSITA